MKAFTTLILLFVSLNIFGQINMLNFDGTNDFVDCGNNGDVTISTGTIEAWIKTSDAGSDFRGIVVKQWAYGMFLLDNVLTVFQWSYGGTFYSSGINLADNRWHHVAFCFNSDVTDGSFMYVDGVLTNTFTYAPLHQDVGLAIGKGTIDTDLQNFLGSIDEVRVWNTVRSQSELQSKMYSELAGTETGLVAYYNFNQGVAGDDNTGISTLSDKTANANHGSITNFSLTGSASNFMESYAMVVPVPAAETSNTGTGFTANWAAPVTGTVSSYKLDVSTSSTFSSFVSGYSGLDCSTSLSQAVSGLSNGTYYYRVRANKTSVTGTGGYYRTAITVTVSCIDPTSGGTIASAQTTCYGAAPTAFTSTAAASGHTGTLEYKWQSSTTSSSAGFSDIASSDAATYSPGSLVSTTWFKRLARVSCSADWSGAAESNVIEVTLGAYFGGTLATSASVCSAITTNTLSISGYTGSVLKWQSSTDNWATTSDINLTSATLLATSLPATTKFRVIIQSGSCQNNSNDVTVTP
jgi:hypothetical protein